MKLSKLAILIKLHTDPQRPIDDLYAEAVDIFIMRMMRGY